MMASNTSENQTDKLISIIIPVYNRAKTLPRLFDSLSKVVYRPIEIILVDNCSDDHSFQLCQQFKESEILSDANIKIAEESKKGACPCRNLGMEIAQGEYLYFFDSDDEMSPDFLSVLASYLPEHDMVCAPTCLVFENGKQKTRNCIPTDFPHDQILSASLSTQSFIVRKDFLQTAGGWDESLLRWNDWELGVRMLCHQPRLKWLPQRAYHKIYQHTQSISGKSYTEDYKNLLKSLEKARIDVANSALKKNTKEKAYNALAFKHLLFATHLYLEQQPQLNQEVCTIARSLMQSKKQKMLAPIVYFLGKHRIPGTWRIYRSLV